MLSGFSKNGAAYSISAPFPYRIDGAYLEITSLCNAKCPYCYNASGGVGEHLDKEIIKNCLWEVAGSNNQAHITLSGGEPTLHPDFADIIEETRRTGLPIKLITNGFRLGAGEYADTLSFADVQLTLESLDEQKHDGVRGKGNYRAVLESFRILKAGSPKKGKLILRINLSQRNQDGIEEFIRFALAKGIDELHFSLLFASGRAAEDANVISFQKDADAALNIIRQISGYKARFRGSPLKIVNRCAPKLSCAFLDKKVIAHIPRVAPDGSVYPCELFVDSRFALGNAGEQRLSAILSGAKTQHFLENIVARDHGIEKCSACTLKGVCQKGCPALSFAEHGDLSHASCECAYFKNHFSGALGGLKSGVRKGQI